jgi:hypothetical protein
LASCLGLWFDARMRVRDLTPMFAAWLAVAAACGDSTTSDGAELEGTAETGDGDGDGDGDTGDGDPGDGDGDGDPGDGDTGDGDGDPGDGDGDGIAVAVAIAITDVAVPRVRTPVSAWDPIGPTAHPRSSPRAASKVTCRVSSLNFTRSPNTPCTIAGQSIMALRPFSDATLSTSSSELQLELASVRTTDFAQDLQV